MQPQSEKGLNKPSKSLLHVPGIRIASDTNWETFKQIVLLDKR